MAESTVDTQKRRPSRVDDAIDSMEKGDTPASLEQSSKPKGDAPAAKGKGFFDAFIAPTTQPVNRKNKPSQN